MLAGRIDASLGGVNSFVLFSIEEKSPGSIKIFAFTNEDGDHALTQLIVKKNSPIQSVADMSGKVLGAHPGSGVQILYRQLVKQNNLQDTELKQMSPSLELQALEAGQIDVAMAIEPIGTVGEQKGLSRAIETSLFHKYFLNNIPLTTSVTSTKFANKNPQTMEKLTAANLEAIDFINNNQLETKLIITKYTPLTEDIAARALMPYFTKVDQTNIDRLKQLGQVLLEQGELKTSVDVDKMIYQR